MAPDRDVGDVHAGAIDRDEAIDLIFQRRAKSSYTREVAEPFFPDVGHEGDGARRRYLRLLHFADDGDEHGQAAAIVADARAMEDASLTLHFDVGAFGKHSVEVRGDDDAGSRRGAGVVAEDVPHLVHAHTLQAELFEDALQLPAPDFFFEWRRWNLAEANLVRDSLRLACLRPVERRFHRRVLQQIPREWRLLGGRRPDGQRKSQPGHHRQSHHTRLRERHGTRCYPRLRTPATFAHARSPLARASPHHSGIASALDSAMPCTDRAYHVRAHAAGNCRKPL